MRTIAKIILIISFAAVLGVVFVFSALGAKNGSQIFGTEFENIKYVTSSGVNYLETFEERIISEFGDGYALYNGHRKVSGKYKSLRLIDGENGVYEYTTFNSYIGTLSKNGRVITKKLQKGKIINDIKSAAAEFYYVYENGKYYAMLDTDSGTIKSVAGYESVLTHSQTNSLWKNEFPSEVAAGVFAAPVDGILVLANIYNDKTIKLSDIESIGTQYLLAVENGVNSVYSLPKLEKIDQSVQGAALVSADGQFAYIKSDTTLKIAGGGEYTLARTPIAFAAAYEENRLFLCSDAYAFVISAGKTYFGAYDGAQAAHGIAYRVGTNIFNSRLELILQGNSIALAHSQGKLFLSVDGAYYSYNNAEVSKAHEAAVSTYGDYGFLKRTLTAYKGGSLREYDLFFNDGNAIYDYKGKKVADHTNATLYANNLLGSANRFTSFSGKSIADASTFSKIYSTDGLATGEYVFKRTSGYYLYERQLFGQETIGAAQPIFVKNSKGAIVLVSADTLAVNDKKYSRQDYNFSGIFGNGALLLASADTVKIVRSTAKKSYEESFLVQNIASVALSPNGAVYGTQSGLKGFIDKNGKSRIDALYDAIQVHTHGLVVTKGDMRAIFSSEGKQLTGFDFVSVQVLGDYFFTTRRDGKKQLFDGNGNEALRAVTDSPVYVKNFVDYNGIFVEEYSYKYFFVKSNGKYRLIKCMYEGYNNINNIWGI